MILYAEAPLNRSLFATDARIRWVAIDDTTARLIFPCGNDEDWLTVHFDSRTHLIAKMTALRYPGADGATVPWRVDFLRWQTVDGITIPARVSIARDNQKGPWSYWDLTGVAWNVDISSVVRTPSSIPTPTP